MSKKNSSLSKASLKLHLKENYNNEFSNDDIDTLMEHKLARFCNYLDLSRLMKAAHGSLTITLGNDAIIALSIECVCSHFETERISYNLHFDKDPFFGLKFVSKIDSCQINSF